MFNITHDAKSLKKDLERYRDNITGLLSEVEEYSEDKLEETRERLGAAMKEFESIAAKQISNSSEFVQQKTKEAIEASRKVVTESPFITIAVSFAAGALTAYLLGKHEHD